MKRRAINRPSVALQLESLERRETPATLVNPTTVAYQDLDGDNVTVKLSKPILNVANVATIFDFNSGFDVAGPQLLRTINLVLLTSAAGMNITTTAVRSPTTGGDGFATLGQIVATSVDLGAVVVDGDLGRIVAGDATTTTAGLKSLTAHSLGRFGTSTGAGNLNTVIQGQLGALTVKGDVKDAFIDVQGGADGKISSINIGGSLIGGAFQTGRVRAAGDIGVVSIRGNLTGGFGTGAGSIETAGRIVGVGIGGDVRGGVGIKSGGVFSTGPMGPVKIAGSVIGGGDQNAGAIRSFSTLASVTIGGDLRGGTILDTGRITSSGAMGPVKIAGNVIGSAIGSGAIESSSTLASVTIGGNLQGGPFGIDSGRILSIGAMGPVKIAGDVIGGAGADSGLIFTNSTLASVTVGGSLIGGDGQGSGRIESDGAMGPIKVTGNVVGGGGSDSGWIFTDSSMASVRIGGSLEGGAGNKSGQIDAGGNIGSIKITGNVVGGSASAGDLEKSGYIQGQRIGTLTIAGSLIAGFHNGAGVFVDNGAIRVADNIGTLTLGNIIGNVTNPAIISARGQAVQTSTDLAIGKLTVKGRVEFAHILAGYDLAGVGVNADAQIGPVAVGGDWIASSMAAGALAGNGKFGDTGDAKIAGGNASINSKIVSLTIGGQAYGTVGGIDHFGIVAENVGLVKIGATTIPTSAGNGNDDFFVGITGDFKVNEI